MKTTRASEAVEKNRQVHEAIEGALKDIEAHAGESGYKLVYDNAIHIIVALKRAGFCIVRRRSGGSAST